MGRMSANMLAELRKSQPSVFVLLEIDFPSGTAQWSRYGVSSMTNGHYDQRVASWGEIKYVISDRDNRLSTPTASCVIEDQDFLFSKMVGRGERMRGSEVRIYLSSANVSASDWFTVYTGQLYEWHRASGLNWNLQFRVNDTPLLAKTPRVQITKSDWPDAPTESLTKIAPLCYGLQDSSGETNTGATPCIYVDNSGFRYLVCLGRAKSVMRVYVDGVRQTSGYSVTNPIVAGKQTTLVDFNADKGSSSITVDVQGYETVGDGTGTLIIDPATQIKHFLVNFVYNEYLKGDWFSDSTAPIDTTSFAGVTSTISSLASGSAYVGGRYIDAQTRGIDELDAWSQTFNIKTYWTNLGALAVAMDHPVVETVYPSTVVRYGQDDYYSPVAYRQDFQGIIGSASASYSFQPADGQDLFSLEVKNPYAQDSNGADTLSLTWGPHFE